LLSGKRRTDAGVIVISQSAENLVALRKTGMLELKGENYEAENPR